MKLIQIETIYVNIDKIIDIYEIEESNDRLTVIEIEGITNIYEDDVPVYHQNAIYTDLPIEEVVSLIKNA